MDPDPTEPITAYIREHRERYTREALRAQLLSAGHEAGAVDAALDREAVPAPPASAKAAGYVWATYFVVFALLAFFALQLGILGIGWLVAYGLLGNLAARRMARAGTPESGLGLGLIVLVPVAIVAIGGGICLATLLVVAGTMQF